MISLPQNKTKKKHPQAPHLLSLLFLLFHSMSTFLFVVVICLFCETFFWEDKNKNLLIPGKALKTGQTKNATNSNY